MTVARERFKNALEYTAVVFPCNGSFQDVGVILNSHILSTLVFFIGESSKMIFANILIHFRADEISDILQLLYLQ